MKSPKVRRFLKYGLLAIALIGTVVGLAGPEGNVQFTPETASQRLSLKGYHSLEFGFSSSGKQGSVEGSGIDVSTSKDGKVSIHKDPTRIPLRAETYNLNDDQAIKVKGNDGETYIFRSGNKGSREKSGNGWVRITKEDSQRKVPDNAVGD